MGKNKKYNLLRQNDKDNICSPYIYYMRFREWLLNEIVSSHAYDRIRDRMTNWPPDIKLDISRRIEALEVIYDDGKSYAVQVYELPQYIAQAGERDESNGDWVVAILRPEERRVIGHITRSEPTVTTVMLRRSPSFLGKAQPFTPQALGVDAVVTLQKFINDVKIYKSSKKAV